VKCLSRLDQSPVVGPHAQRLEGGRLIAAFFHANCRADPDVPVSNEAEARLPSIVQNLRKRFDYALVNGPDWGCGGAAEWASLGDSVYLVVRAEQWDAPEMESAHDAIVNAGGKLRGYITMTSQGSASKLSARSKNASGKSKYTRKRSSSLLCPEGAKTKTRQSFPGARLTE
jgi:hypothetical protein